MSHDLSHSQSQLLGFQVNPLSHLSLSLNSFLHSHLHLSSFHFCLLLKTLASSLHLYLQVSCHSVCFVITPWHQIECFDIYVFKNILNTPFNIWIIDITTTPTAFIYINTKMIKHRLIIVDIYYFCSCFTILIIH